MDKPAHRTLAGVVVPDTPIVDAAIEHARQHCAPYLFNHVVRSWLFAARLGQLQNVVHDEEVLAVGTLLHDITLNESFAGPRRFEVEGADLARHFAAERGFDRRRAQLIWDSVALNSTPVDRSLQRERGCTRHGRHLLRRHRAAIRHHPRRRSVADRRRIPANADQAAIPPLLLPYCKHQAGNKLRQFHPGFRRTLCRRIQRAFGG
ncbi:hypothetical protein [Bradyrhizobium sp. BRP23]|uniref:hypothetical protein n=1 Tax=Bradyrhizobium sp. BRP23 TaxID=2793820 RepID=UPI001CD4F49D|nr:hypothetical protein [Bradyrhizobium sp. BRP23]